MTSHQRLLSYYRRYTERLGARLRGLDERSRRLGWARLAVVLAGAAAWWAFAGVAAGAGWVVVLVTVAGFVALARMHRRLDRSQRRHRLCRTIKAEHAARMARDWDALPPAPLRRPQSAPPPDEAHPFAPGLDVTGPHSLLRLIDTCATEGGSRRLRGWLLEETPRREAILQRQALVRELASRASFCDRLALEGRAAAEGGETEARRWSDRALRRWLEESEEEGDARALLPWIAGLGLLGVGNLVLMGLHFTGVLPPLWAATLPLYLLLYTFQLPAVKGLFEEAAELQVAFRRLRSALRFLEERPLAGCPGVRDVLTSIRGTAESDAAGGDGREQRPSRHLQRVARISAAASSRRSEVLALVNLLGPWDLAVAYLMRRERARLARHLPAWLEAWYRLEALAALAGVSGRRPAASFPEIAEAGTQPVFEGDGLAHPLLPEEEAVRNGIRFEAPGAVALITGSNMAGKSTFLRTMGLNLTLAYAGGPVDARRLRAVPMRLFTCIDVSDAVTGGLSYFYAEVRRLRALKSALKREGDVPEDAAPLFYLVDEIFRGTNNRERLIGSRAYLRALARADGVGAVATHDLELTELSEEIDALENYHFREEVEDAPGGEARMTFDYTLRRGPCPTTNALKIMRAAGLPTDGFAEEHADASASAAEPAQA